MIAAPGWSILPSPFRSSRCARQPPRLRAARAAARRARSERLSRRQHGRQVGGQIRAPRRSCVAAMFIAATTEDRRVLRLRRKRRARAAAPAAASRSDQWSSAAAKPRAGLLFQLTITPPGGSIACGCASGRQEAAPLELAVPDRRQPEVDARGPDRQAAGGEVRDVPVVRVDPVEAELDLVHHAHEVLRRVDAPLVEVVEGERAQDLAPARRALRRDRDLLAADGRVAEHRPVYRRTEAQHSVGRSLTTPASNEPIAWHTPL